MNFFLQDVKIFAKKYKIFCTLFQNKFSNNVHVCLNHWLQITLFEFWLWSFPCICVVTKALAYEWLLREIHLISKCNLSLFIPWKKVNKRDRRTHSNHEDLKNNELTFVNCHVFSNKTSKQSSCLELGY